MGRVLWASCALIALSASGLASDWWVDAGILPDGFAPTSVKEFFLGVVGGQPAKSQYETQAEYASRMADLVKKVAPNAGLVLFSASVDQSYDADKKELSVTADTIHTSVNELVLGDSLTINLEHDTVTSDSYEGMNSFGAKTTIQRTTEVNFALCVPHPRRGFPKHDELGTHVLIKMEAQRAKALATSLRLLVIGRVAVQNGAPINAWTDVVSPTVAMPVDRTISDTWVFLDVEAMLLYNSTTGEIVWRSLTK